MAQPNDGSASRSISGRSETALRSACIGFDRVIDTDVPIVGTVPLLDWSAKGPPAAIRVRRAPTRTSMSAEGSVWSFDGDMLSFAPPGVALYRCTDRVITIHPLPGASEDAVDALLVATALPAVLWRQGAFVIHAATIVAKGDDAALAIAGQSGVGKSTLAAEFLAHGARLVADDSIAVRTGPEPVCAGLAGGYHLGADGETRSFHAVSQATACQSAPLRTIVVLDDDPDLTIGTRLTGVAAVEALLANRHRAIVARQCGLEARSLRDAASLARSVAVYRWPRHQARALLDDDTRQAIMGGGER